MPPSRPNPSIRVERIARGEARAPWIWALADFDPHAAIALKNDDDTAVWRCTMAGRDVVLKCWTLRSPGARLKHVLRAGRADRHWRNAAWLAERGIGTARCLVLATEHASPPRRWLVMEHLPGPTLLEELRSAPVRSQHLIARSLGAQLAEFAARGVYNRDHKPSNLIVRDILGGVDLCVLDCVAIHRGAGIERMMASLIIEPAGCGVPVRRGLAMRVLSAYLDALGDAEPWEPGERRHHRALIWNEVSGRARAHGDPTPRVNPLAKP